MRLAALSLLLLVLSASLTAAPNTGWINDYQQGRAAYDAGRWADAAKAIERALAANSTEQLGVRIRSQSIEYVPHFWLGLARLKLGDTSGARASLSRSESQGVIQKTTHYTELRKAMSQVEQAERKRSSDELSSLRRSADEAVAAALAAQGAATGAGATRHEDYRRASTKLDEALAQSKGQPTAESYNQKASLARQAAELFDSARKESVAVSRPASPSQKQPALTAPQTAPHPPAVISNPQLASPKPAEVAVPRPPTGVVEKSTEGPQPTTSTLRVRRLLSELNAELKRDAGRYETNPVLQKFVSSSLRNTAAWEARLKSPATEGELAVIAQGISSIRENLSLLRSAARPVVAERRPAPVSRRQTLEAAYLELSRGRLRQAETLLSEAITADSNLAEAFMLRGCVRYTSAVLASEKAGLESAQSDFRAALKINPALRLEPSHFSPKLIAFFERTASSSARP